MNTIEKIQEFIENINSDYFWNEQSQAFFLAANYYLTALRDLIG